MFYIALENHNFTQPSTVTGIHQQLFRQFGGAVHQQPGDAGQRECGERVFRGQLSERVARTFIRRSRTTCGRTPGLTGPLNDNDPFPNNIVNAPNLSALLAAKGQTWRSYQEDTDLVNTNGNNINGDHGAGVGLTNTVAPKNQYEVPLTSFSGTSASYTNPYNGSHQYNYAAKHNPRGVLHRHQRG